MFPGRRTGHTPHYSWPIHLACSRMLYDSWRKSEHSRPYGRVCVWEKKKAGDCGPRWATPCPARASSTCRCFLQTLSSVTLLINIHTANQIHHTNTTGRLSPRSKLRCQLAFVIAARRRDTSEPRLFGGEHKADSCINTSHNIGKLFTFPVISTVQIDLEFFYIWKYSGVEIKVKHRLSTEKGFTFTIPVNMNLYIVPKEAILIKSS